MKGGFCRKQSFSYSDTYRCKTSQSANSSPSADDCESPVMTTGGCPQSDIYNINSQFAVPNEDDSVTIHFGGDENADNHMDIFEGWDFALRIYELTEAYLNGEWALPELEVVERPSDHSDQAQRR